MRITLILTLFLFLACLGCTPGGKATKVPDDSEQPVKQETNEQKGISARTKIVDILSGNLRNVLLSVITIAITAAITWYVNFRLSHLEPIIAITNIQFFYDLKGEKELIEIPDSIIEADRKGFFGMGLEHFMTLDELDKFTSGDRVNKINKRYDLFQKEIDVFIDLLTRKPLDADLLSHYALSFLRSYGFNGVASFLIFLEEEGRIDPLAGTQDEVGALKAESGTIMLSPNSYLLIDAWSKQAKNPNEQFMARKIEWFAKRMALNLLNRNFATIERFMGAGKALLNESRKYDVSAEEGILEVIEEKAAQHKKVGVDFQLVNRSDYPLLLLPTCALIFESPDMKDEIVVKADLSALNLGKNSGGKSARNSLFKALVVDPKSNMEFSVQSRQISSNHLIAIKNSYEENRLKLQIDIQVKLHKGRAKNISSELMELRALNAASN